MSAPSGPRSFDDFKLGRFIPFQLCEQRLVSVGKTNQASHLFRRASATRMEGPHGRHRQPCVGSDCQGPRRRILADPDTGRCLALLGQVFGPWPRWEVPPRGGGVVVHGDLVQGQPPGSHYGSCRGDQEEGEGADGLGGRRGWGELGRQPTIPEISRRDQQRSQRDDQSRAPQPHATAEPVVTTTKIHPETGDFVVIACDGLWEMLSNEEVVALVAEWIDKKDQLAAPNAGSEPTSTNHHDTHWLSYGPACHTGTTSTFTNSEHGLACHTSTIITFTPHKQHGPACHTGTISTSTSIK
ncbi:hypothetical protein V8F06_013592 [Rhypophila decipiens]